MSESPKHLIRLLDIEREWIEEVLDLSARFKAQRGRPDAPRPLAGKPIVTLYEKPSTRTKVSFEAAIYELGGYPIELTALGSQISRGETYGDTARVLSRYGHAIVFRALSHDNLVELARHASVPVINALTDLYHPCQMLSDLFTIREHFGDLRNVEMAFIGNGSNIVHSLGSAAAKLELSLRVATPPTAPPRADIRAEVLELAEKTGARIEFGIDPGAALTGADVVYTDVWFDIGHDHEAATRLHEFEGFQLNSALLAYAKPTAVVMHCLPAKRGQEITDEVLDGPQSIVFDQAENRLHTQKAILALLVK